MTDGKDVFVHYSDIADQGFKTLRDGEEVNFVLTTAEKGLKATDVKRIIKTEPIEKEIEPEEKKTEIK